MQVSSFAFTHRSGASVTVWKLTPVATSGAPVEYLFDLKVASLPAASFQPGDPGELESVFGTVFTPSTNTPSMNTTRVRTRTLDATTIKRAVMVATERSASLAAARSQKDLWAQAMGASQAAIRMSFVVDLALTALNTNGFRAVVT